MSRSRRRAARSALLPSMPAVAELEFAHKALQDSIDELNTTVSALKNLENLVENVEENVEKDQQERNRLAKSGTLVL